MFHDFSCFVLRFLRSQAFSCFYYFSLHNFACLQTSRVPFISHLRCLLNQCKQGRRVAFFHSLFNAWGSYSSTVFLWHLCRKGYSFSFDCKIIWNKNQLQIIYVKKSITPLFFNILSKMHAGPQSIASGCLMRGK